MGTNEYTRGGGVGGVTYDGLTPLRAFIEMK